MSTYVNVFGTLRYSKISGQKYSPHIIMNLVKDKELSVEHIRSEDNPVDAGSKHCVKKTHVKHATTIYTRAFDTTSVDLTAGRVSQIICL